MTVLYSCCHQHRHSSSCCCYINVSHSFPSYSVKHLLDSHAATVSQSRCWFFLKKKEEGARWMDPDAQCGISWRQSLLLLSRRRCSNSLKTFDTMDFEILYKQTKKKSDGHYNFCLWCVDKMKKKCLHFSRRERKQDLSSLSKWTSSSSWSMSQRMIGEKKKE